MGSKSGGASAPPRPRDARGRFLRTRPVLTAPPADEDKLLQEFKRNGLVRFPDPFGEGIYTIELGNSMKNFPARMFHSEHKGGAFHLCRGDFNTYGGAYSFPYGYQLAISPMSHYGWPGDKWEGEWTAESMAQLLIHLAHSAELQHLHCGDSVYSGDGRSRPVRRYY